MMATTASSRLTVGSLSMLEASFNSLSELAWLGTLAWMLGAGLVGGLLAVHGLVTLLARPFGIASKERELEALLERQAHMMSHPSAQSTGISARELTGPELELELAAMTPAQRELALNPIDRVAELKRDAGLSYSADLQQRELFAREHVHPRASSGCDLCRRVRERLRVLSAATLRAVGR